MWCFELLVLEALFHDTLAGKKSGVHKRIQNSTAHAIYIHNSCNRLQLTSIRAAASIKEIRMFLEP